MEEIRNKFLLLDTNVLIDSSKHLEEFQPFYDAINALKVQSVLDHTAKLEFLRGIKNKKQQEDFTNFLSFLFGKDYRELVVDNDILERAVKLAIVYGRKNIQVEMGDYLIGAQMYKFSGSENLYLATSNHADFPRFIFDRIAIHTIDVKKADKIINIGIYKFNKNSFDKAYREFEAG